MDRTVRTGEIYRHFKNKLYQIVTVAEHSESREMLVIYQALYGDFKVYARPLEMFLSEVDHEKYPQVTQKYRFERVDEREILGNEDRKINQQDCKENSEEANTLQREQELQDESHMQNESHIQKESGTQGVSEKLMEFLDADTMEARYNILVSMRDEITDSLIDNMAVVVDVVIPEGDLYDRYDELKNAIRTRQRYEYANRLRS